jgi:CheY-like chemotaxis protein
MKSLKVLLLEDQPFQMMAMCRMLNSIGVSNVLMADSADSATQLLERHRHVDITICDLQMKGTDGLDFIRYLSETDYAGALIIVSSSEVGILSCVARMAHESGISVLGYLEKPASSSHFRVLFDKFMAQPRPQEDLRSAFYSQKVVTVQEVTKALQESELVAYFQPKVAMNGLVVGVEALVRWPHSTLGMLSPAQFLPVIESAGLSDQLMWFMLEQALSVAARQELQDGSALPVAVNISPEVLLQRDFSRGVLALVAKYALSP